MFLHIDIYVTRSGKMSRNRTLTNDARVQAKITFILTVILTPSQCGPTSPSSYYISIL